MQGFGFRSFVDIDYLRIAGNLYRKCLDIGDTLIEGPGGFGVRDALIEEIRVVGEECVLSIAVETEQPVEEAWDVIAVAVIDFAVFV